MGEWAGGRFDSVSICTRVPQDPFFQSLMPANLLGIFTQEKAILGNWLGKRKCSRYKPLHTQTVHDLRLQFTMPTYSCISHRIISNFRFLAMDYNH
jgi:hypothetical protein